MERRLSRGQFIAHKLETWLSIICLGTLKLYNTDILHTCFGTWLLCICRLSAESVSEFISETGVPGHYFCKIKPWMSFGRPGSDEG